MSSITLTLTGDSANLTAQYCPAIDLSDGGEYVCGLIDFQTFNSIPNIDETNNLFYFGYANLEHNKDSRSSNNNINNFGELIQIHELNSNEVFDYSNDIDNNKYEYSIERERESSIPRDKESEKRTKRATGYKSHQPLPLTCIEIPTGSYELDHLAQYLRKRVEQAGGKLALYANNSTLQCELFCNQPVDFSKSNTIGPLLGFRDDQVLEAYKTHVSQLPANILKVNVIRVECNIITGSYLNNQPSHTIHEFSPRVPPGYKIIEVPQHVIYFPITVKSIQRINLSIVDQHSQLINFRGETITIRLHIKKVKH